METWYEVSRYNNDIKELEVIRSTEKMLIVEKWGVEGRMAKDNYGAHYFPTREGAIEFKRNALETEVGGTQDSLERAERELAEFNERYPKEDK